MGVKTKDLINDNKDKVPGPGQYDVLNTTHSKIKHEPAFSMGSG
jgi:hypothetical protein